MSKVTALYHIVFCTKRREMTLPEELRDDVYRFIWNEIKKRHCKLLRIGGIANHIHLLVDLHPDESLSDLVKNIKANSSGWLRRDKRFANFDGWAKEYFAASVSPTARMAVIKYIMQQPEHHSHTALTGELQAIYAESGLVYDDRDMN